MRYSIDDHDLAYRFQVLGVDDDLLGAVEGPEDLVVEVLLHPRPRSGGGPQLDGISLDLRTWIMTWLLN